MPAPFPARLVSSLLVFFFLFSSPCHAFFGFKKSVATKSISGNEGILDYELLTFPNAPAEKKFPLVVVFQGSGVEPLKAYYDWEKEAKKQEFMVLAPFWTAPALLGKVIKTEEYLDFIKAICKKYPAIEERQIFAAGVSAGAVVANKLITDRKEFWRGGVLVAYAPGPGWAEKTDFQGWPPLLFAMGERDAVFQYEDLIRNAHRMKEKGGIFKLILDPNAEHEHRLEWNQAIFGWMKQILKNEKGVENKNYS